jgi:hypothetical protein
MYIFSISIFDGIISDNVSEFRVWLLPVAIPPWLGSGRAGSSAIKVTFCLQVP